MKIVERIKLARKLLRETLGEFGSRFNFSPDSVSNWEKEKQVAPYSVIEFCEEVIDKLQICPACNGTGIFNKSQDRYFIALGKEGFEMAPFLGGGTFQNIKPAGKFKMIAGKAEELKFVKESN